MNTLIEIMITILGYMDTLVIIEIQHQHRQLTNINVITKYMITKIEFRMTIDRMQQIPNIFILLKRIWSNPDYNLQLSPHWKTKSVFVHSKHGANVTSILFWNKR